jgi:predicted GIY-YIG superfamily endonuclease
MAKPFHAYMILCSDGTYYVGHTDDLERRFAEHEQGGKCAYTSLRRPVKLVWCEQFTTREEAKATEVRIKKWNQTKKAALIRGDFGTISSAARKSDWEEYEHRKRDRLEKADD